jgi:hypothetical protein
MLVCAITQYPLFCCGCGHNIMMRLPTIEGLIRRRLLINFRADPEVVARLLPGSGSPGGLRPKLHRGYAIVGICLIRLEHMRPKGFPEMMGLASENAAHRIAVQWDDEDGNLHEGVYVPRRDTDSIMNSLAGGRIFPGEQHLSQFAVEDDGQTIRFSMASDEGEQESNAPLSKAVSIRLEAHAVDSLPATSIFTSLAESSAFFEGGCIGYSATCNSTRLDGMELKTQRWEVQPLEIVRVESSFFEDPTRFPDLSLESESGKSGPVPSIRFDHALIMRDIPHEWHSVADFVPRATV